MSSKNQKLTKLIGTRLKIREVSDFQIGLKFTSDKSDRKKNVRLYFLIQNQLGPLKIT